MDPFPGPRSRAMLDELGRYVISDPWPFAIDVERCRALQLMTVDDQPICDWAGVYGARLLGWNHPRLRTPEMIQRLAVAAANKTANPDLLTAQCLAYYRMLHRELAPQCMRQERLEVYVVNSGAEAVENLMKYFITLHQQRCHAAGVVAQHRRFIVFDQAFHGRTVYALNATRLQHDPVLTRGFHGLADANVVVPFPALDHDLPAHENQARAQASLDAIDDALRRHGHDVVGIIVEPIQGAGGHRLAADGFFRELSQLAQRYAVPLGFDEVQTAGGQCGAVFAADLLDLAHPPMAIATAKKFGCGVLYMHHPMDDHGVLDSTWGGTLADMVRVVEEFAVVRDERLIEQVPAKAALLRDRLRALQHAFPSLIGNVRGMGIYQGFTVLRPGAKAALIERALQQESLLILGAGPDGVRLRPPLDVTFADIEDLAVRLHRCCAALR